MPRRIFHVAQIDADEPEIGDITIEESDAINPGKNLYLNAINGDIEFKKVSAYNAEIATAQAGQIITAAIGETHNVEYLIQGTIINLSSIPNFSKLVTNVIISTNKFNFL